MADVEYGVQTARVQRPSVKSGLKVQLTMLTRFRATILLLALLFAGRAGTVDAAGGAKPTTVLPPAALRGYGTIAGRFWSLAQPTGASLLQIDCESVSKAQLLHAKYLSDLGLLPGVKRVTLPNRVEASEVAGQGAVCALRDGRRVLVLTAPTPSALARAVTTQSEAAGGRELVSKPEVQVPMWLDRWDKFGFRFYYRPWMMPHAGDGDQRGYDITKEFSWAQSQQRSGLVFWEGPTAVDTGESIEGRASWDWAQEWSKAKGLPVGVNDAAGFGPPTWLANRYREENSQPMPGFVGTEHSVGDRGFGAPGWLSWSAGRAKDVQLGLMQSSLRRWAQDANVTTFLEPHGELRHGAQSLLLEYGPVADAGYRTFLREKYGTLAAVNARWETHHADWGRVRVPELASFAGGGADAFDLTGPWRVSYEQDGKPAPSAWFSAEADDASWPELIAPGHDRAMLLPKKPAVFRRHFAVPAAWKAKNAHVWLYAWDMNGGTGDKVAAYLNGSKVGEDTLSHATPHRGAWDVSKSLRAGDNVLALRLPQGMLAYRVYLSPHEPRQYPDLGKALNAQWADFTDWQEWSHAQVVRRGMEMIRQVDANRSIVMMAPEGYVSSIKPLAEDFGGEFHDTGIMGVIFADYLPMLARGSNLPFSVEPGGPAGSLDEFKKMIGLYSTQGVQGLDYFIHIGNVMWPDDIRRYFEDNLRVIHLLGKYHSPRAEVAVLLSSRSENLSTFPFGSFLEPGDADLNLRGGYWNWNAGALLRDFYERDAVSEFDFARGNAGRYRVIVDSNTAIMDAPLARDIEKWVRAGGTFITLAQTGRHTSTAKDAWPISRLSGYRVTHIDRMTGTPQTRRLKRAPGQTVFRAEDEALWDAAPANGLSLQRVAPDAHDLLLWEDGSVAAGCRPLGKGFVVHMGAKFSGGRIPDHIDPGPGSADVKALTGMLTRLLEWRKVAPIPARLSAQGAPEGPVLLRHFETNNGLYDVWTLWNQKSQAVQTDLVLDSRPTLAFDVQSGTRIPISRGASGATLPNIALEGGQTRVFLTPRGPLSGAPLQWLDVQRHWWRASQAPRPKVLPAPEHKLSRDLSQNWAWKSLGPADNAEPLAAPGTDDLAWAKRPLGFWSTPGRESVQHALFRRAFTVPAEWNRGRVELWLESWYLPTFADQGRVFLDGRLVRDWNDNGVLGETYDGALKPGSTHTLAVEIRGEHPLVGSRGPAWLWYQPTPQSSLDLAGEWTPSRDALHLGAPVTLPGGGFDALTLRRVVTVPASHRGQNAVLSVEGGWPLVGVIVNGHLTQRHGHRFGDRWTLNITPWVRWGQPNEIELFCPDLSSFDSGDHVIRSLRLDFHNRGDYP